MSSFVIRSIIATLVLFNASLGSAQLLVEENFLYTAGASLHNQNGGFGWANAWYETGIDSTSYDVIADGSLGYGSLLGSGRSLRSQGPTSYSTDLSRTLSTVVPGTPGTTVWISFLVRKDSNGGTAPYDYFGLALYPSDSSAQALFIGDSGETDLYSLGIAGSDQGQFASANASAVSAAATFLVVKVTFANGSDLAQLFVNPDPAGPAPVTASATKSDLDIPDIFALGILGGLDALWTADQIKIGRSFADVAPTSVSRPDFNGDGKTDYVLYHPGTRRTAIWYLNNALRTGSAFGPTLAADWSLVDVADFDANGKLDYVLFNSATRRTAIWYMSGPNLVRGAYGPTIASGYELMAAGDFNGDGKPDFVLYHPGTRRTALWYLNGSVYKSSAFGPTIASGWKLVDVTDFDRDGKTDYLLSQPSTRKTAIWYLSGPTFARSATAPTVASGYELMGAADLNGDGSPDYVLLESSTLRTAHWYLRNNIYTGGAYGPTLASGYVLAAP